ncbi:MAG: hypothetical protein ABIY56_07775 [Dokdonella sp.]
MTRILELLVSLLIVFALVVLVGVMLPSHGHIERSVEVSNPVRQIYDSLNTFQRFREWSDLSRQDRGITMELSGPRSGEGAKVSWNSRNPEVGQGSLTIIDNKVDDEVKMALVNSYAGENKTYTLRLEPSANKRTTRIFMAYDVDYGWNLAWRYAGMYIHGKPDTTIQSSLSHLSNMLAGFPNVDYRDQDIQLATLEAKPMLLVSTKAKRNLDDVMEATDVAVAKLHAAMEKAGLEPAGPRMTITTTWGDENYGFDVAIPVNAAEFTLDGKSFTITAANAAAETAFGEEEEEAPLVELQPGAIDSNGYLVVDKDVRATMSYAGEALMIEYTGSPAALPLLRNMEKAYAETHGYGYTEMNGGRFWDEVTVNPELGDDEQTYKVYLPVQE